MKKSNKKQQPVTVWDKVKNDDKDFYFSYLEKKVRNLNKKTKEIDRLEQDLKENKDLKPEQLEKIKNKDEVTNKIAYYEELAYVWIDAWKESKGTNARKDRKLVKQIEILLSEMVSSGSQIYELVHADNQSLKDISYKVAEVIESKSELGKDVQWPGLNLNSGNQVESTLQKVEQVEQKESVKENVKEEVKEEVKEQRKQSGMEQQEVNQREEEEMKQSEEEEEEVFQTIEPRLRYREGKEQKQDNRDYGKNQSRNQDYKNKNQNQRSYNQIHKGKKQNYGEKQRNEVIYVAKN